MNCTACHTEIGPDAKFCLECGHTARPRCSQCNVETLENAKFCHECGNPLQVAKAVEPKPAGRKPESGGTDKIAANVFQILSDLPPEIGHAERRQLSVIFADLASFNKLSQKLDPEDLNMVMHEYYGVCQAVCERYDGQIANYLGDGVLILYGYPKAREEDAHRAVRTGLGIVEGLMAMSERLSKITGAPLNVRVGIHTGIMITDDQSGGDWLKMALGQTLNVAARIQAEAKNNTVVVSAATRELIEGYFDSHSIGHREMKGVEEQMELFEVTHESTARCRLEAVDQSTLTPLTGRDGEMELLLGEWEAASRGDGRILLIRGEGGIGKSRLVQHLKEHVASLPDAWLTPCQCSPYHQNTTMFPFIDLIERVVLKFERHEPARDRLKKLEGMLVQYGFHIPDILPIYGTFHSLPPEAGYTPSPLDPAQQRRKYMDSMIRILNERSRKQPLLFVVEDLHWVDPTSLEVLKELVEDLAQNRLFALFSARPDFESPWDESDRVKTIDLDRLPPDEIDLICRRVARGKKLPTSVLSQIRARADGIPLFAEELTKMVIGSDLLEEKESTFSLTRPLSPLAIPSTLQDSLMARLDKLNTAKEVAQVAAVIGRSFKYEMIRHVLMAKEEVIRSGLDQLVDSELLIRQGIAPDDAFLFSHALIREAAYQSLTKRRRLRYHLQLAEAIEQNFPETCEVEPQIVAHHFYQADVGGRAIPYLQRAGDTAAARSSHKEAIVHYQRALETIPKSAPNSEMFSVEIQLLIGLGVSLTAIRGYGAEEVGKTYARARDLSEQIGDAGQLFRARYGLWRMSMLRAEYQVATAQGEQLLELAQRQDNTVFLIAAHRSLGSTLFYQGQFQRALEHIDEVIQLTSHRDENDETPIRDVYDVVDPRVTCRSYRAWILWMQGYPVQARQESHKAVSLAERMKHPFSQALALSFATWLKHFLGDVARVRELSDAAVLLSKEYGFTFWFGWCQVLKGWADGTDPEHPSDLAINEIHEGLNLWKDKGSQLGRGYFRTLLAEVHISRGEWDEADSALAKAKKFSKTTDERYWEAERLRLQGVVRLARDRDSASNVAEALDLFQQALQVSQNQNALSLELRAATSIAQLYHSQNNTAKAKQILEPVIQRFTEGHETTDLRKASDLLNRLSATS